MAKVARKVATKLMGEAGEQALTNKVVRKELLQAGVKKLAKKAGKEAVKGAIGLGADVAIDYAMGGDAPNMSDVRAVSRDTGLQLAQNRLNGQTVTSAMVHREARLAARKRMLEKAKTRTKPPRKARPDLAERIRQMQLYAEKLRMKKKAKRTRGYSPKIRTYRAFGTGVGKGKKKKKKKTTKKKKKKKAAKKGSRPSQTGLKRMNVAASQARYMKMRDVFDIDDDDE